MALIRAVDAAYPPDVSTLDDSVRVVLGYIGQPGCTPHIWTREQVDAVRASGREWWAIIVPPQGAMSSATGIAAADHAIAVLPDYAHPKSGPVFFDVESGSWEADAAGALTAVNAFKARMREAGYTQPFGYLPPAAGFDWFADWTNVEPASLPAGCVGQQYASNTQVRDGWDHSVFLESLYANDPQPDPTPDPVPDPAPAPAPGDYLQEMYGMALEYVLIYARDDDGKIYEANVPNGTWWHIPDPGTLDQRLTAVANSGVPYRDPKVHGYVQLSSMRRYGVEQGGAA